MKSASSRDAMTARVKDASEQWSNFYAMPETKEKGRRFPVAGDPSAQQNYVNALYACCSQAEPIGRDGTAIVGRPVADDGEDAAPKGRRMKVG